MQDRVQQSLCFSINYTQLSSQGCISSISSSPVYWSCRSTRRIFQFGMKIWIPNTPRGGEASLHVIVQSLNHVWIFAAPQTAARQASLSISNSQSLPKLTSTEWVMPSSHLILCRPLLLPPSIFPSMKEYASVKFHLAQPLAVCQLLYAFHTRLHFLEACASVRLACSYFNDKRKVKECQRACTWRAWRAENVNRKSIPDPAPGHPLPPPQAFHPNSACSWFLSTSRKETVTVSLLLIYTNKLSCVPGLSQSRKTIPSASQLFRIRLGLEAKWNPLPSDAKSFVLSFPPFLSCLICTNPWHSFLWFSWPHLFLIFQMPGKIPRILVFLDS